MKVNLLAYGITALVAVGAGIAIAGLPSDPAETVVIDSVAPAAATTSTIPPTTVASTSPPETDAVGAVDAVSTTTSPAPEPSTTTSSSVPEPSTTTINSVPEPSTTTSSSVPEPSSVVPATTAPPLVAPAELAVAVINGSGGTVGLARDYADLLAEAGYTRTRTGDAFAQELTTVYAVPGLEREAFWLINVADVPDAVILPVDDAPNITANGEFDLILVLGLDSRR